MTSGCIGQVYFCIFFVLAARARARMLRAIGVNRPYLRGDVCRPA